MRTGYLKVITRAANEALPVPDAAISIYDEDRSLLYTLSTDGGGVSPTVRLDAPDAYHDQDPDAVGPYYGSYEVDVYKKGFIPVHIKGVQIYDGIDSYLPVKMLPLPMGMSDESIADEIKIGKQGLESVEVKAWDESDNLDRNFAASCYPKSIVVHLGKPGSIAPNLRISFLDYIKNVACSEVYPTWPLEAIKANIYAEISFALHRILSGCYKDGQFCITSSVIYDPVFYEGRNLFDNVSQIVDEVMNICIHRAGEDIPYFAQYCNGAKVNCTGMSQWGLKHLVSSGFSGLEALQYYYSNDIELAPLSRVGNDDGAFPGIEMKKGDQSSEIELMQKYLNRIHINYADIPLIAETNGFFGDDTALSVYNFQELFNLKPHCIIDKATWYQIITIYEAVLKLELLEEESLATPLGGPAPETAVYPGEQGKLVLSIQFLINYIAAFFPYIMPVTKNSNFDQQTAFSVTEFQRTFNLEPNGIVDKKTWAMLYDVYYGIKAAVHVPLPGTKI